MPRSSNRGGRNNNPSGRNQYSDWGVMEMARERPFAAAAAAAGAAAAGLFLWSKRAQIGEQLSSLSDQIGEWTEGMRGGDSAEFDDTAGLTTSNSMGKRPTGTRPSTNRQGMSQGGATARTSSSSRGRSREIPSTT